MQSQHIYRLCFIESIDHSTQSSSKNIICTAMDSAFKNLIYWSGHTHSLVGLAILQLHTLVSTKHDPDDKLVYIKSTCNLNAKLNIIESHTIFSSHIGVSSDLTIT